ncbi:MAG: response regulator [Anaerolineae bacterium]
MTDEAVTGRLLLVDDSEQGAAILRWMLQDEGFDVLVAHSGEEALDLIARRPPDLVILDVLMPGISGMEVLKRIRANPDTEELPVIMVTALADTQDIVKGLELGANDYLSKPPQFEILLARVRIQIKLKRLQDQRREDLIQLRHLDSVKDQFLRIAAHDLRNPLQNLSVGVELLQRYVDDIDDDQLPRIMRTMRGSINTMESVITDFLDLQAIRSGTIELRPMDISLNTLVDQHVEQFTDYAADKSVALRTELDPDISSVELDPERIGQVVDNLVGNAIKFSPEGSAVDVRTIKLRRKIRVEIEDDGPGIPEDDMPLLFQEFARLTNRPTGGEKSSGLGLAICRYLIEEHGGTIGAYSERDKGSLFWFELPLKRQPVEGASS